MSAVAGVIFDLDGVLVSTDMVHYQAWSTIADRLGIEFSHDDNDALRGVSRSESLDRILALGSVQVSDSEKELLAAEKNALYRRSLSSLTQESAAPGAVETLEALRSQGMRLAIGSSSKNAKFIVERIGLLHEFDAISDGENITQGKPDPEVFLRAASFLALRPDQCVVVEDARAGVDAAVAGGFRCFGIGDAAMHPDVTWPIVQLSDMLDYL